MKEMVDEVYKEFYENSDLSHLQYEEEEKADIRIMIAHTLKDIASTHREVSEKESIEDHLVSEPRSWHSKVRSISQNMYEIEVTIFMICLTYYHESIVACGFILAAQMALCFAATYERSDRIVHGRWLIRTLMIATGVVIISKISTATWATKENKFKPKHSPVNCYDIIYYEDLWVAFGYNHDIARAWVPVDGVENKTDTGKNMIPSKIEYLQNQANKYSMSHNEVLTNAEINDTKEEIHDLHLE
jgi:hypothetical protein